MSLATPFLFYPPIYEENGVPKYKICSKGSHVCRYQYVSSSEKMKSKNVFIFFHGNGEDAEQVSGLCQNMAISLKCDFFILEYPGYGLSDKDSQRDKPLISRINADAELLIKYLIEDLNIPISHIILMGRSIGCAPACQLASKYGDELGGLILYSPFTSVYDIAGHHASFLGKMATCLVYNWDTEKNIAGVNIPTMIIHGSKDSIIPSDMGLKVYMACPSLNKIYHQIPDAEHNDFNVYEFLDMASKFLKNFKINQ